MAIRSYDTVLAKSFYDKYQEKGAMLNYLSGNAWIPTDKTKRPLKANYVYDESLDTFQAGFLSKTVDSKLPNGTLCRLIYEGYEPTYDSQGRPLNHDICVIANGNCKYQPNAEWYIHDYNLVELMELMKNVRMETLSFTSQESISVTDPVSGTTTTYKKEPNNLYKMLVRILKLTRTSTSLEDNSYYSKIQIMDTELLQASGIGVDDAFVENTLYDAMFKIGHYIGRVPVLYLNKDYDPSVSGSKEFMLFYERKDGIGGSEITKEELFEHHKGWVESQVEEKDADTVVSDVRNMVSNRPCTYPGDDYYCFPTGEESLFELTESTERKIVLPHKISEVIKLKQLQIDAAAEVYPYGTKTFSEIPVYEYKNWIVQSDRNDCAYFKEGENVLYFGKNIAKAVRHFNGVEYIKFYLYNIKYYPMLDGKIISRKDNETTFETTFNQVDNFLDASTYGNMLEEYIKQHGSADLTLKKRYAFTSRDVNDYLRIPKIGSIVRYPSGDKYVITNISFDADIWGYECIFQLNKDYVRRNAFTGASQRIRNEGLIADKMYERFTNLSENIYVDLSVYQSPTLVNNLKYIVDKSLVLAGLISDQSTVADNYIQAAYMEFKSLMTKSNNDLVYSNQYIMGNVAKTQSGKTALLNVKFNNNTIAASTIINTYIATGVNPPAMQTQSHVKYTDPFGGAKEVQIGFGKFKDIESEPTQYSSYDDFASMYPELSYLDYVTYYNASSVKVPILFYDKDLREVFNFTYQLHFRNTSNTIITDEFVKYCGLLGTRLTNNALKVIVLNFGEQVDQENIIVNSQISKVIDISNIVYYNSGNSVKLDFGQSYTNIGGLTCALAYQVATNVYKPLLIGKIGINTINALYIHV
jgi:hypothetical protein